jgi:hypothetical protein
MIRPPSARLGVLTPEERKAIIAKSPIKGKYDTAVDAESAFEILQKRTQDPSAPGGTAQGAPVPEGGDLLGGLGSVLGGLFGTNRARGQTLSTGQRMAREITRTVTNRVAGQVAANLGKSLGGSVGGSVGRAIVRGALGSILRSR